MLGSNYRSTEIKLQTPKKKKITLINFVVLFKVMIFRAEITVLRKH